MLTQEGANISIAAGSYRILLYVEKPDYAYAIFSTAFDKRGFFWSQGQKLDITDITLFTDGYAVNKFKNVTSDGAPGSDSDFPDTDFPLFRLGDVYLMASEALLRSGGDRSQALNYFNAVRTRAYGSPTGGIQDSELTLDMILDERARELYWEAHRRTDLVRFGKFSNTDYRWAWKGGTMEGRSVDAFRDVYPIPSPDLGANPNLVQNNGY
ncbi:MAG: RagB/SusD family nutrient uptake outer membrane protein [Saprospiraceae bacterium]|nr:RagB/SusD family nutrient uptake outer membrane protein [Saprospiraceae bacterium]